MEQEDVEEQAELDSIDDVVEQDDVVEEVQQIVEAPVVEVIEQMVTM